MDLSLIKIISARKNIKLDDLAEMANIKRSTFFNYLSGKTSIPADTLKTLSDILDIPIAKIYAESNNLELLESKEPPSAYYAGNNTHEIPLVHKFAYSGFLSSYDNVEYIKGLPKYPALIEHSMKSNYLCFEVNGDGMSDGSFESRVAGDIILTREFTKQQWSNDLTNHKNNFVIVHKEEGILIKRIVSHDTELKVITVRSLNNQYEDVQLSLRDILKLFGEVKLVGRN